MAVHTDLPAADPARPDRPAVATITLDRPERRNALDADHCRALTAAVTEAVETGHRSLVLLGAGPAFCAGADFSVVAETGFRQTLYELLGTIAEAPVPVVAGIDGPAIGAGLQLAMACDLRLAGPRARFAVPTARLGLAADPWTVERLVALAGGGPARRLLLACEQVSAETAAAIGLVDRLVEADGEAGSAAAELAADLATMAPLTLSYSKAAVAAAERGRATVDPDVLAAFEACWSSRDLAEGLAARGDGRDPTFEGR